MSGTARRARPSSSVVRVPALRRVAPPRRDACSVQRAVAGRLDGLVTDAPRRAAAGAAISAQGGAAAVRRDRRARPLRLPRRCSRGPYFVRATCRATPRRSASWSTCCRPHAAWRRSGCRRSPATAGADCSRLPVLGASSRATTDDHGDDHSHSPMAWRMRHLRRPVLRDEGPTAADVAAAGGGDVDAWLAGRDSTAGDGQRRRASASCTPAWLRRPAAQRPGAVAHGEHLRLAAAAVLRRDASPSGVAYVAIGVAAGPQRHWDVQAAISQGDLSSWVVRRRYEIDVGRAAHRSTSAGPTRCRATTGRNPRRWRPSPRAIATSAPSTCPTAGRLRARPSLTLGTRYARYGYVEGAMCSARRLGALDAVRRDVGASHRLAGDDRAGRRGVRADDRGAACGCRRSARSRRRRRSGASGPSARATRGRDRARGRRRSSSAARAFQPDGERPDRHACSACTARRRPRTDLGHYLRGQRPATSTPTGWGVGISRPVASRVRGSVAYSVTQARLDGVAGRGRAGAPVGAVGARAGLGAHPRPDDDASRPRSRRRRRGCSRSTGSTPASRGLDRLAPAPGFDARFDVQVSQRLPFLDFTSGRVGGAGRGAQPVPRRASTAVGLRRTARRPAAEAHRRRPDGQVLDRTAAPACSSRVRRIPAGASAGRRCRFIDLDAASTPWDRRRRLRPSQRDKSDISVRKRRSSIRPGAYRLLLLTGARPQVISAERPPRPMHVAPPRPPSATSRLWRLGARTALALVRRGVPAGAGGGQHLAARQLARGRGRRALGAARPEGVVAAEVAPRQRRRAAGVQPGDLLLAIDGQPVETPDQVVRGPARARRRASDLAYTLLRGGHARRCVECRRRARAAGQPRPLLRAGGGRDLHAAGRRARCGIRRPGDPATLHFFWLCVAVLRRVRVLVQRPPRSPRLGVLLGRRRGDAAAAAALPALHAGVPGAPGRAGCESTAGRRLLPLRLRCRPRVLGVARIAGRGAARSATAAWSRALSASSTGSSCSTSAACLVGGLRGDGARAAARARRSPAQRQLRWIVVGHGARRLPVRRSATSLPFALGARAAAAASSCSAHAARPRAARVRVGGRPLPADGRRGHHQARRRLRRRRSRRSPPSTPCSSKLATEVLPGGAEQHNTVIARAGDAGRRAAGAARQERDPDDARPRVLPRPLRLPPGARGLRARPQQRPRPRAPRRAASSSASRRRCARSHGAADRRPTGAGAGSRSTPTGSPARAPARCTRRRGIGGRLRRGHAVSLDDPLAVRALLGGRGRRLARRRACTTSCPACRRSATIAVMALGAQGHAASRSTARTWRCWRRVAGQVATALENGRLYQQLQRQGRRARPRCASSARTSSSRSTTACWWSASTTASSAGTGARARCTA